MAIQKLTTVAELSSYLGIVNFYTSFVPSLSGICKPLFRLTQADVKWSWSRECQHAFDEVKRTLSSATVLTHFNPALLIGISGEASPIGLGTDSFPDGTKRPTAYLSKVLPSAERKYSQVDREALGIYYGCKMFYQYLHGRRFTLVTDHKNLTHIFSPSKQLPAYAISRIHSWSVYLSQFQYDVVYWNTKQLGKKI